MSHETVIKDMVAMSGYGVFEGQPEIYTALLDSLSEYTKCLINDAEKLSNNIGLQELTPTAVNMALKCRGDSQILGYEEDHILDHKSIDVGQKLYFQKNTVRSLTNQVFVAEPPLQLRMSWLAVDGVVPKASYNVVGELDDQMEEVVSKDGSTILRLPVPHTLSLQEIELFDTIRNAILPLQNDTEDDFLESVCLCMETEPIVAQLLPYIISDTEKAVYTEMESTTMSFDFIGRVTRVLESICRSSILDPLPHINSLIPLCTSILLNYTIAEQVPDVAEKCRDVIVQLCTKLEIIPLYVSYLTEVFKKNISVIPLLCYALQPFGNDAFLHVFVRDGRLNLLFDHSMKDSILSIDEELLTVFTNFEESALAELVACCKKHPKGSNLIRLIEKN
ncbi:hypothetical protein PCE1_002034 [Barthelona sp. PCE]